MFNTSFHKINWDGQLRAHVAQLCTVAWRKLVLSYRLIMLAKTAAPTYRDSISPISYQPHRLYLWMPRQICHTPAGKFRLAWIGGLLMCMPDSLPYMHKYSQVAHSHHLKCG